MTIRSSRLLKITPKMALKPRFFDIGVNLTDSMFHGKYRDKHYHDKDLPDVLLRANYNNVDRILITGSSLKESGKVLDIIDEYKSCYEEFKARLSQYKEVKDEDSLKPYCTIGVHPCSVKEFSKDPAGHIDQLRDLIRKGLDKGVVKAFGEIGLDYDRLYHASKSDQCKYFELQLKLACEFDLPLFLHMRAACDDFITIIKPFLEGTRPDGLKLRNTTGVIHSFTGSVEELEKLEKLGLDFSVNGCSLKTEENLEVVKRIPLSKLHLETDAPWCEIKKSSACFSLIASEPSTETQQKPSNNSKKPLKRYHPLLPIRMVNSDKLSKFQNEDPSELPPVVKSRNEPCFMPIIAQVMAKLLEIPEEEIIQTTYENSCKLFKVD
ncbi:3'--&gt5' exonuclease and endonuclease with a possible role in apoptosis [Komagataella phaffii GS115]|uniref:3'-->5' exonuclease and endonuclease with a possible role in apoptosis n=2 Tax=Komagataella phaffii TaxID=460519 RepID=C4R2H8_KOMPG|nr:3'--&gt5' exonuclease and endonuclease with a possible role in apoptosis [Komagataella phaffii GS115]AOA62047.1 GQ67_01120T0 [Komagataella phaffii]AOA67718.1 GQ68_00269T0 [Komagataella phaffii GS115]CAY69702.1 3'--&gt5' exonuclease and endonuclease with a possible role in apoptosis [Komagataella phaffii GS115]